MRQPRDRLRSVLRSLINDLFDPLFIVYWLCWFFIRFCRNHHIQVGLLNSWLTDFTFVPIIVHVALVLSNHVLGSAKVLRYPLIFIVLTSALVSVSFEWILPQITTYNVGDPIDVLMYFSGGLFYYYVHQHIYIKKLKNRQLPILHTSWTQKEKYSTRP